MKDEKRKLSPDAIDDKPSVSERKKPKVATTEATETAESFIELSDYRRVTVREYKGKTLVDFREFYKDKTSGELKPGSKGLSLTLEQWEKLKENMSAIDAMILGDEA
ncbi:activated RNA polymerase II transcriptional coactivator p15, partial [Tremellales sp. Uapishka_1]